MSTLASYRTAVQLRGYDGMPTPTIDEAMQAVGLNQVDADQLEEIKSGLAAPRKPS